MPYVWKKHEIPNGVWNDSKTFYWLLDTETEKKSPSQQHVGTLYVLDGEYYYDPQPQKKARMGMSRDEVLAVYTKMEELRLEEYFADIAPTETPEST